MLRDYQQGALKSVVDAYDKGINRQLLAMATGCGKCLAKGTPVIMFDGTTKPVEHIVIGDLLMGPDSAPRTVLSLGHGYSDMFTVVPTKGNPYTVNDAHILSLYMTKAANNKPARYVDMSVQQYLATSSYFKHRAKGYRVGVEFPTTHVPVDPYGLGLWLGDGNSNGPALTTKDEEILNVWGKLAASFGLDLRKEQQDGNAASTYYATTHTFLGRGTHANGLLNALRSLGVVGKKHVPHQYKANSRAVRIALLSGYLAADGNHNNGGFEFVSVSKTLADDMAFVARSLGLACYVKPCVKGCQTGAVGTYYRGFISGDCTILHVGAPNKKAQSRKQKKSVLVTGIKVLPAGYGEYFGFQLNGDGRFLLGDFTVTHNTVIFANLLQAMNHRIPGQMWVIAHREELIDQAVNKIRHWNPTLLVDKEMAEHYANPMADVIVSCVASIGRKGTERSNRFDWDAVTKVVIDEAHHTPASQYMNFLGLAGFFTEQDKDGKKTWVRNDTKKLLLGVTATPQRGDGKALAEIYDKITYAYDIRHAMEDGWLADLTCWRVYTDTNLDSVHTADGDFQPKELSAAINTETRNKLIVNGWREKGDNRQTLGFCIDIQHAKDLAEAFRGCGIKAEAVWGDDPDRARKLSAHRSREFPILCNCGVLTEGYDDWQIGCILLARPTKSGSLYTQMVGRGTRLEDGTGNLLDAIAAGTKLNKTDCILIDVTDATSRHKLQTAPSLLGMDLNIDFHGRRALASVKEIESAQAANPNVDFSKLKDITSLKTYIQSVNLWADREVPEEVQNASKLDWHKRTDGSYMLIMRSEEVDSFWEKGRKRPVYVQKTIYVKENILGKFEITSTQRRTQSPTQAASTTILSKAETGTLEDALRAVDAKVIKAGQDQYLVRGRQSTGPASDRQRAAIAGYYKKQLDMIPFCLCVPQPIVKQCTVCSKSNTLTNAQASNLISQAQLKRRKDL